MLKVFTDGYDTVIATDADHATRIWEAIVGHARTKGWVECLPGKEITVRVEQVISGRVIGEVPTTMTAAQWAEKFGTGFLCSTET